MSAIEHAFKSILVCPSCRTPLNEGFSFSGKGCSKCHTRFFDLKGLPCLFPAGISQKLLWEDLYAKFLQETTAVREENAQAVDQVGLSPMTRKRMADYAAIQSACHKDIESVLQRTGLSPKLDPRFKHYSAKGFVQYYELMLRDWAWQGLPVAEIEKDAYRGYMPENVLALTQVLNTLPDKTAYKNKRMVVLGSGAGRLSWDLHQSLQTSLCAALDFNPLLSFVAHQLVKQNADITLSEGRRFPRSGLPEMHEWQLSCADEALNERRRTWHAFAADAWAPPFEWHTFDVVLTPWFLDINGCDAKYLIEQVSKLLKEGGTWINYGPLLYPEELPFDQQYTFDELKHMFELAGFEMQGESFQSIPYTHSPLSERGRVEDIWCSVFTMKSSSEMHLNVDSIDDNADLFQLDHPPAWYILPHLPVPSLPKTWVPDTLQNIAVLMNGERSINEIADALKHSLPEDHNPVEFVYNFLEEFAFA